MSIQAFRSAIERHDAAAIAAAFAPDAVLLSPAIHRPFKGREAVSALVYAARGVLSDFRYTDELAGEDASVLVFEARVGDLPAQGIDLVRLNDQGQVREMAVMIRPLSAGQAFAEAMGPHASRLLIAAKAAAPST
jgi:hypothetical protein